MTGEVNMGGDPKDCEGIDAKTAAHAHAHVHQLRTRFWLRTRLRSRERLETIGSIGKHREP